MKSKLNGNKVILRLVLIACAFIPFLAGSAANGGPASEPCQGTERSKTLVSDKGTRSYVESSKHTVTDSYAVTCGDSADLYLARKHERQFGNVLSKPADSNWSSIGLKQIDWSRDGRYLLLELRQADSGGERTDSGPLVYDSVAGHPIRPDILKLFQSHFHKNCANDIAIEGLTPDDDIVLTAKPVEPDPTFEPGLLPTCIEGHTKWAINFRENIMRRLPHDYKAVRHSHFEVAHTP